MVIISHIYAIVMSIKSNHFCLVKIIQLKLDKIQKKRSKMKKIIIMAVSLLALNFISYASTINEKNTAFHHIVINGDVDIVLVENDFVQIDIKNDQSNISSVSHYVKKGTLYINRLDIASAKKPTIIISVNDLKSLEVNGDGDITSKGSLRSNKLKFMINGELKLNVRNYGEIMIESASDIKLNVEKFYTRK